MSVEPLRQLVSKLNVSAGALAALGAALDARASGVALEPDMQHHVDDVIRALGVGDALAEAEPAELTPLLGEIRTFSLTNNKLLFAGTRHAGWAHTEPEILLAAGEVSVAFAQALKERVAGLLPGLAERLDAPGAAFLDIGVGVGAMSIEMARLWPHLRIVGIDRWTPSLRLARERTAAAGLSERIELREASAEELADVEAFDLVWLPTPFLAEDAVRILVGKTCRALRPGGWLLFPMLSSPQDPLTGALARLRTVTFGGFVATDATAAGLLTDAGFFDARTLPRAPNSLATMVVARRPLPGETQPARETARPVRVSED